MTLKQDLKNILENERLGNWYSEEERKETLANFWNKIKHLDGELNNNFPKNSSLEKLKQREKIFYNFLYWRTRPDKKEFTSIPELISSPIYVGYEATARFSEIYSVLGSLISRRKVKGKKYNEMKFARDFDLDKEGLIISLENYMEDLRGVLPEEKSIIKALKVFREINL